MPPGRASNRWLAFTLILATGVYAWYAVNQYYYLSDLHQRQLSLSGNAFTKALRDAVGTVVRFNDKWNRFNDAANKRSGVQRASRLNSQEVPQSFGVCDFDRLQPYLDLEGCEAGAAPDAVPWKRFTTAHVATVPGLGIEVTGDGATRKWFRYRTDLLMQELAFSDSFALIFIASDTGVVLYHDTPARRRWLRYLRWGEQMFRDAGADGVSAVQIHDVRELVGGDAAWKRVRSVSSRTTVELGGTAHELYLQPLRLENELTNLNLVIGGAVSQSSVRTDALALGTSLQGILVFLLVLALLGYPFVKLAFLDLHEHFGLRDIQLLYTSTGALLVLLTCASLGLDGYFRWQGEADRGLRQFAVDVEARLVNELKAIRGQLSEYDDQIRQITDYQRECSQWQVHTNWLEQTTGPLPWPKNVHLKTVMWVEPGGWQIWKTTADAVPGKIWVGDRPYFRAIRDDNLFRIDGEEPAIHFGPDRSVSDGEFYTFVSIRSRYFDPHSSDPLCVQPKAKMHSFVVAASAQLLSLDSQTLPAGYGFALINREGRVLYHSDARLSLRENFFDELSNGARARAMIYAGRGGMLATRYRERPHRFYLHPIRLSRAEDPGRDIDRAETGLAVHDAAFHLAMFRDSSTEQALVGHAFAMALGGPMALFLIVFAGGFGLLWFSAVLQKRRWSQWLWPHGGLNHVYQRQTGGFMALLIVSTLAFVRYDTLVPFVLSAFVAPVVGILIYWRWAPKTSERQRLSSPVWQRLAVFSALVCIVVVPSAALFRITLSHEFGNRILTEREWIRAQDEDWLRKQRVKALEKQYARDRTDQLRAARRKYYLACVPAPFVSPGTAVQPAVPLPDVLRAASAALQSPPEQPRGSGTNCTAVLSHAMGALAGFEGLLHRFDRLPPVGNDILARQYFQSYGETYSPSGTIVPRFRASILGFFGLALTLAALYFWIRWNTNRLFLADLDTPREPPEEPFEQTWTRCTADEQIVLVQIGRERIANPYQRSIVEGLLRKRLLRLDPDVQPFSDEFDMFLQNQGRELEARIKEWQEVNACRSWRYGRLVFIAAVVGLALFLFATQPALQSSVTAIAAGLTGLLTAIAKLREAIASWMARKASS